MVPILVAIGPTSSPAAGDGRRRVQGSTQPGAGDDFVELEHPDQPR